jgi:serine/threonine protein kinase
MDQQELRERIHALTGWEIMQPIRVITDTSDCMDIQRGDIIRLNGSEFLIKGNKYEGRFGISYQPKYWVFGAIDMNTCEEKIIKTVFDEDFHVHIGVFKIHCYRSPEKESRVLELVRGDDRFMQGYTKRDERENSVRVIDVIRGPNLMEYIYQIDLTHYDYFNAELPRILARLAHSLDALALLHRHGTCHGDIRNDHIIVDRETGAFRWIDFDLNQHVSDFDTWSIGNVINYVVGKGINSFQGVLRDQGIPDTVKESLTAADASAFYEYRIMNLEKLYPYIPRRLSGILKHFTVKPETLYTSIEELVDDYREMLSTEFPAA